MFYYYLFIFKLEDILEKKKKKKKEKEKKNSIFIKVIRKFLPVPIPLLWASVVDFVVGWVPQYSPQFETINSQDFIARTS